MGWEKYIVLANNEYEPILDSLYEAFQKLDTQYTFIKDEIGFTLCGNDSKWPEIMQMGIYIAHQIDYAVPDGEKYIYCLFHVDGHETHELRKTISNTLEDLGVLYTMDDL